MEATMYKKLTFIWVLSVCGVSSTHDSCADISATVTGKLTYNQPSDLVCEYSCRVGGKCDFTFLLWSKGSSDNYVYWQDLPADGEFTGPQGDYAGRVTGQNQAGRHTLTINSVMVEDEGSWTCGLISDDCVSGKGAREDLFVNVAPTGFTMSGLPAGQTWVERDKEYSLTCSVASVLPAGDLQWRVGDRRVNIDTTATDKQPPDEIAYKLEGGTEMTFSDGDDGEDLRCEVTSGGELLGEETYRQINVYYRPVSSISRSAGDPIEGLTFTFTCETDAVPADITSYTWWRNNTPISGETGRILTLKLDHTLHDGSYQCMAENVVGDGERSAAADLKVWYLASVTLGEFTTSPVVEGYDTSCTCSVADGFPTEVEATAWTVGGADVGIDGDRITGGQKLTINRAVKEDDGDYGCEITTKAGSLAASTTKALIVHYSPRGTPSLTFSKNPVAVNEDMRFLCSPQGDAGVPAADKFSYHEGSTELHNGSASWETRFPVVKQEVTFGCRMSNYVGVGSEKGEKQLEVQAVAHIEDCHTDTITAVATNADFSLDCLGSGHEPSISWTKAGSSLPGEEFEKAETKTETGGPYKYEQTEATRSTVKWKPPTLECGSVTRHQGEYRFSVTATAGGEDTTQDRTFSLQVHYPPIKQNDDPVGGGIGQTIQVKCDVCAAPAPTAYRWTLNGQDLRDGIDGANTDTITINNVTKADFVNYTCEVTNDVDTKQFNVRFVAYSVPETPDSMSASANSSRTILVTWLPGFNGGLPQKFTLEGKKNGESEYVTIKQDIPDPNQRVKDGIYVEETVQFIGDAELDPDTEYDFRVWGQNDHPDVDGGKVETHGKTLTRPTATLDSSSIRYTRSSTHMYFKYQIDGGRPTRLAMQYRRAVSSRLSSDWSDMVSDLDLEATEYDGETGITLEQAAYEFQLRVFEGNIVTDNTPDEKVAIDFSPGDLGGGAIAGIVIGVLGVLALSVVMLFFVSRMRQKEDYGGSRSNLTELHANQYAENGAAGFDGPLDKPASPEEKVVVENANEETAYAQVSKHKPTDRSKMPMPAIPDQTPQKPKWEYEDPPSDMEEIPEEEENPYGSAPPVPDRYYAGDFYANVDENGEKLYDPDYRCPPGEESDYWEFAGEMRKPGEKPVRISYFKETIYQRFYWYEWPMSEAELENYG